MISVQLLRRGSFRSTATTRPLGALFVVRMKSVSPNTGPELDESSPTMMSRGSNRPVRNQRSRSTTHRSLDFVLV